MLTGISLYLLTKIRKESVTRYSKHLATHSHSLMLEEPLTFTYYIKCYLEQGLPMIYAYR